MVPDRGGAVSRAEVNEITLHRYPEHRDGTPGLLTVMPLVGPAVQFNTMELHYRGNVRFESSIPAGSYSLVWHGSAKYPRSWALVGKGVVHAPTEAASTDRYAVLMHRANWSHQVQGCIAVGERFMFASPRGFRAPRLGVAYSGRALRRLASIISDGVGWRLLIKPPPALLDF